MSSIQIKSTISMEELVQIAAQLQGKDLDQFIQQILFIRARREVANLSEREAKLLELINESISGERLQRFQSLDQKRQAEELSPAEQEELIQITTYMEAGNVKRIQYLSELALLRQTSLRDLMNESVKQTLTHPQSAYTPPRAH